MQWAIARRTPALSRPFTLRVDLQQRQVARQVVGLLLQPGADRGTLLPHLPDLRGEGLGRVELAALQLEVGVVVGLEDRVVDRGHGGRSEDLLAPVVVEASEVDLGLVVALQGERSAADRFEVGLLQDLLGIDRLPDVLRHDEGPGDGVLDRARVVRLLLHGEPHGARVDGLDRLQVGPHVRVAQGHLLGQLEGEDDVVGGQVGAVAPGGAVLQGQHQDAGLGLLQLLGQSWLQRAVEQVEAQQGLVDELALAVGRGPGRRGAQRVEVRRHPRGDEDEQGVPGGAGTSLRGAVVAGAAGLRGAAGRGADTQGGGPEAETGDLEEAATRRAEGRSCPVRGRRGRYWGHE